MLQMAFPIHTFQLELLARLKATARLAFPEARDYHLAFAEMEHVACFANRPDPIVLFHQILDHPNTPLYVFESILAHELCHQVLRQHGRPSGHTPEFFYFMDQRLPRGIRLLCDQWVDLQLGHSFKAKGKQGFLIDKNWRKHYLRERNELFDWQDQQQRLWSVGESSVFRERELLSPSGPTSPYPTSPAPPARV